MKLSNYLEDCCAALESAAEYPTDIYLVHLTRLQGTVERMAHCFQYNNRTNSPRQKYNVPILFYIAPFERDLDQFLEKLPDELRRNSKSQRSPFAADLP